MKSDELIISRGPQFRNGKSAYLFLLFMTMLVITIALAIGEEYETVWILAPIMVVLMSIILDIQGVQIDRRKKRIRTYKRHLWGRFGKWSRLNDFDRLFLDYESYNVQVATFNRRMSSPYTMGQSTLERHGHFVVRLAHKTGNDTLLLVEARKHKDAKRLADKISEHLRVPLDDVFQRRVEQAKRSRRNY